MTNECLDLLDALIYGEVFNCAVTLGELWRYARIAVGREELSRRLRDDPIFRRVVVQQDGLYSLRDRTASIRERPGRALLARRLQRRARFVARILRHLPFVRGIALTGSVSADDATAGADVDFLTIVASGRIGTVFLLLGALSRLFRRRAFCPNWYICEDALALPTGSLYIAREFAQAHSLVGNADALLDSNPWILELFPNVVRRRALQAHLRGSTRVQQLFEAPLRGAIGNRIERIGQHVAAARLRIHYAGFGQKVPEEIIGRFQAGVALGFHGYLYEQKILKAYAERRIQVLKKLEQAGADIGS